MWRMVWRQALVVLWAGSAVWAFAADPLPGMWAFEGETTGKPGRGFQIDRQDGHGLILTYFGYRTDGSALFLQASGFFAAGGHGAFEGDLVEYRGGTAIGAAHRDGEPAQVLGLVRAVFDSPSTGTITLPGEAAKRVRRFVFEDHAQRFNRSFRMSIYDNSSLLPVWNAHVSMRLEDGVFRMTETYPTDGGRAGGRCDYEGVYASTGKGIQAEGSYVCDGDLPGPGRSGQFRTDELIHDRLGFFSGVFEYPDPVGDGSFVRQHIYRGTCIGPTFLSTIRCRPVPVWD